MPCIVDGNKILDTPIKDIIEMLRQQIQAIGSSKLKDVVYKTSDAIVTCPVHKGGCENKPACYVSLIDKSNVAAGTAHCFSCGYRAGLVKFVADCLGIPYRNATEWLLSICDYSFQEDVRDMPQLFIENSVPNNYSTLPTISVSDLKKFDYIHPYMFQRKLTDDIIKKFEVGYDPDDDALTFPVYVDGKCLFIAKRRVKFKQFLMPEVTPKPIYGLDYLTDSEVIVCESVINALTCWAYGRQAVALFGTGSDYQIEQLKSIPQRKVILALDPDTAGRNGTYKIRNALNGCKIVRQLRIPDGKDINDLSKEEFENLEEIF